MNMLFIIFYSVNPPKAVLRACPVSSGVNSSLLAAYKLKLLPRCLLASLKPRGETGRQREIGFR